MPSSPPTAAQARCRQGPGAGSTEAASSRSRICRWYAESVGSRSGLSVGALRAVHFFTRP
ncbi:hypothetical protein AS200_19025 [Streptomyces sp. CdTB01]|nr:hypothetical protein AS200_19025 [Streptomyces sp. CdTB01]